MNHHCILLHPKIKRLKIQLKRRFINYYSMEFLELTSHLIQEWVQSHLLEFYHEDYEESLIEDVYALLAVQFEKDDITYDVIYRALEFYDEYIIPRRVSPYAPGQEDALSRLECIRGKPQPEQRTPEWYEYRYGLITASAAYKILGTVSKQNELICDKCAEMKSFSSNSTEGSLHWGIKYEPLSCIYYESTYHTRLESFGCIVHDTYPYLGASPDGINIEPTSPLMGRMLEIKNPISREITGNPKEEYWIQCQLQMEVCNLDTCDFLETKFTEYDGWDDFIADGTFQHTKQGQQKGIILHYCKDEHYHYEYAPWNCTQSEFETWEAGLDCGTWLTTVYWKLEQVSCVLIRRNKPWFYTFLPHLTVFWNRIVEERKSGAWTHRLPKSRNHTRILS